LGINELVTENIFEKMTLVSLNNLKGQTAAGIVAESPKCVGM
jgi:hypothetical protein